MKRVNEILSVSGLVLALSLPGWAQRSDSSRHRPSPFRAPWKPSIIPRIVNIRKADGSFETVNVPSAQSGSMSSRSGTRCR